VASARPLLAKPTQIAGLPSFAPKAPARSNVLLRYRSFAGPAKAVQIAEMGIVWNLQMAWGTASKAAVQAIIAPKGFFAHNSRKAPNNASHKPGALCAAMT
jgi:hypothetical protein